MDKIIVALGQFHKKCYDRMIYKEDAGVTGWDKPEEVSDEELKKILIENMQAGDFVDVSNIAMILNYRQRI